ncbi:MAG TPA: NYN domain-containing protein, partial [Streptosporangiaceae bacterium]
MSEHGAPVPLLARYAVMVDVGYIYAAAGELLLGTSSRRDFRVDAVPLIEAISKHADELVRGELLRVYWYDAARDRVPTIDQRVIAQLPQVKLRLGNLNARGQQKGVDAQIRADMEALARHRAITDAVLVAGDEDMVPAVEAAQAYGVRVHLWGIDPPYGTNQAERLVWESDTVDVLDTSFVRPYFTRQPSSGPDETPGGSVPSPAQLFGDRIPPRPSGRASHLSPGPGAGLGAGPGAGAPAAGSPVPAADPSSPPAAPAPASAPVTGAAPVAGATPATAAATTAAAEAGSAASAGGEPPSRLGPDRLRVEEAGEHVAHKWLLTRGTDNIRDLLPGPILPPVIDKELLVEAEKELGLSLRAYQEAR